KRGKANPVGVLSSSRARRPASSTQATVCGGQISAGLEERACARRALPIFLPPRGERFMAMEEVSGTRVSARPAVSRRAVGISSLFLGVAVLYFVGFTPAMAVHNAAHDTRHTAAFPCH